jgi:hypothetical protein
MDGKPRAIRLAKLEEEPLQSGRKLLHCIFEDCYGNHSQSYRWTAPWRSGSKDCGILQLFYKSYEIEEYNDPEGVWNRELKKAAEEIPPLGEMKLPVKIEIGRVVEDKWDDDSGIPIECWRICIEITRDEQNAIEYEEPPRGQYLAIGKVSMAWGALQNEIYKNKEVMFIQNNMESIDDRDNAGYVIDTTGVRFCLWLRKFTDRIQYQAAARDISFRIRSFIRYRLSEYKSLKRGFQEQ